MLHLFFDQPFPQKDELFIPHNFLIAPSGLWDCVLLMSSSCLTNLSLQRGRKDPPFINFFRKKMLDCNFRPSLIPHACTDGLKKPGAFTSRIFFMNQARK